LGVFARLVPFPIADTPHDRVDVLGLSWGGALAQELARRHPGRIRRLVLVATTPGWVSVPGRPTAVSILLSPARYYSPAYLRRVAPTLYGGCIRHHLDVLERHAHLRSTRPPSQRGYLYQLSALRRWSSLPWLHTLPQPTLVLAGDDDPIVPVLNARLMASRLARGRLEVIHAGGHLFLFTHPEETAATITGFLEEAT
jgi:poly(3-hydroxyoctanoate) depolymerase